MHLCQHQKYATRSINVENSGGERNKIADGQKKRNKGIKGRKKRRETTICIKSSLLKSICSICGNSTSQSLCVSHWNQRIFFWYSQKANANESKAIFVFAWKWFEIGILIGWRCVWDKVQRMHRMQQVYFWH